MRVKKSVNTVNSVNKGQKSEQNQVLPAFTVLEAEGEQVSTNGMKMVANSTLCWRCVRAVPGAGGKTGCSWSREFAPVEGWWAEPKEVYDSERRGKRVAYSYNVILCPEFIEEKKREVCDE